MKLSFVLAQVSLFHPFYLQEPKIVATIIAGFLGELLKICSYRLLMTCHARDDLLPTLSGHIQPPPFASPAYLCIGMDGHSCIYRPPEVGLLDRHPEYTSLTGPLLRCVIPSCPIVMKTLHNPVWSLLCHVPVRWEVIILGTK